MSLRCLVCLWQYWFCIIFSLGSPDDEYEASENCSSDSYFIMSSEDSSNYESDTISVIPLRFSRCSKDAMKSHINTLV